jgi:hypothetical protein
VQLAVKTTAPLSIWKHTISVTYDGSSSATWVVICVDGIVVAQTILVDNLSNSILNWNNQCFVWFDWWWLDTFDGKIRRASFVDYVKNAWEMTGDHTAGTQSNWTWTYLFAADLNRSSGLTFLSSDPAALTMDIMGQIFWDWVLF